MNRKSICTAVLLGLLCMSGSIGEAADYIPVQRRPVTVSAARKAKPAQPVKKAQAKVVKKGTAAAVKTKPSSVKQAAVRKAKVSSAAQKKKAVSPSKQKVQNKGDSETGRRSAGNKVSAASPDIEVGLLSGSSQVVMTSLAPFDVVADGKRWKSFPKGTAINVSYGSKGISVNGKTFKNGALLRTSGAEPAFLVKGNRYRGQMKLIPSAWSKGVTVVNVVSIDDYLKGVVPCEVVPSWHMDALKAQAVAARTYAVYHKNSYRQGGYDVTDDTRSQVYKGAGAETAATTKAVVETAGEVVTYGGKPIDAVFHASGGGYTENSENVWGTTVPYLKGVPETMKADAWTKTFTLDTFNKTLAGASPQAGKIKNVKLSRLKKGPVKASDRGISGRVKLVEVVGSKGKATITGERMQGLFGLPSTMFDIRQSKKNIIITGYGSGHGLGLSQWGAEDMAARHGGKRDYYKDILLHYYTGTKIEKIY